ncbi:MAG TPA: C40 family peptidase [Steroidobacteraceae bacterium]
MRAALALAVALLLTACSSLPATLPAFRPPDGAAIAKVAASLIGAPYHFGGADAAGFDCSGLALYVHERVGVAIPRTAAEQRRAAHPVPLGELAPGDLVFFRIRSRSIDHVGVYAGSGRFIHARRAGLAVAYGDLRGGTFYARHLVSAGRFWGRGTPPMSPP